MIYSNILWNRGSAHNRAGWKDTLSICGAAGEGQKEEPGIDGG